VNQAGEDAPGAIAEVHSDTLRWLISDDDPRRPIAHALLYTEEAIRAAVAHERERAAGVCDAHMGHPPTARYLAAEIRRGE